MPDPGNVAEQITVLWKARSFNNHLKMMKDQEKQINSCYKTECDLRVLSDKTSLISSADM